MSLILDGTNGLSDVDGSAATPAIRGSDANTGIFFPAADTIAFAEGGAEAMRIDSDGDVGIGTTTPGKKLDILSNTSQDGIRISGSSNPRLTIIDTTTPVQFDALCTDTGVVLRTDTNHPLIFSTNGTERASITSSGNLLVGTTSATFGGVILAQILDVRTTNTGFGFGVIGDASNTQIQRFYFDTTAVGSINVSASATNYSTSSDYRLKHDIQPMTGALAKVALLKPVTYKWKVDGSDGQGFIAHELAEVEPGCVTGEKDAVDAEGNPQYQGIDTSFLVATLTAAIQEQQAIITALTARVEAQEVRLTSLEGAQA
jgi:hypothetical protein